MMLICRMIWRIGPSSVPRGAIVSGPAHPDWLSRRAPAPALESGPEAGVAPGVASALA
jgi:hypothetical protein